MHELTPCPPQIGAAQVAFINPPTLKLDFTNAANIADNKLIDRAIRKVILKVINSMFTLPNRFLVKVDSANDFFKSYQPQLGVLRLTVERAQGIKGPNVGGKTGFLKKLIKDVPDCFCEVAVSAEEEWKTTTQKNNQNPEWNETHDFLVSDHDQRIVCDLQDDDLAGDDDIGIAEITVRELLLAGKKKDIELVHKGENTGAHLSLSCQYYQFVPDKASFTAQDHAGQGSICGLVTMLVGGAFGIPGRRQDLQPSVKVVWGDKTFQTAAKTDAPGMDIENPSFDVAFRVPLTQAMVSSPQAFKVVLMNKKEEMGSAEVPFEKVLGAPNMVLEEQFEVGAGAKVRVSFCARGVKLSD
jgi:Ca2+-dependent lipid-binding protein